MRLPDKVEHLAVASLMPYANNARTHSPEQVAQIAASIREYGFTNPVLVDGEGGIIAGHGRVMAAQRLGMDAVPCIRLDYLSDAQRRAYVIADNQLALNAGWDESLLKVEVAALDDLGYDLALLGFDDVRLEGLLADEPTGADDDDAANQTPAAAAEPITHPGEIWQLGRHRLICGSSTDADTVDAVLDGVQPHLMVTDPPYGVDYDASWRTSAGLQSTGAHGKVENDGTADWREAWALFPGEVAYVWHAGRFASTVQASLAASEFEVRCQIIWAKTRFAISRGHYHWQHEPCWYAVRKGGKGHWGGARDQSTLWTINHIKSETGHSTQKPVECMRRPIENNSSPGQAVYEPFSGSGTTIIACEQTARVCYAIELNPLYVDVAVRRWQQFTGKQATLAGKKGKAATFGAIVDKRGG